MTVQLSLGGGGGGGYGGGANWAPDKHEQFKVWGDETCLLLWRDVSNFWCIFLFPGRLIQFIDLGNGVWAKKKKYNILLHLLQWLTGRAAEKKFFPVYRWIFDNDQSLCARCRNFSECKLQKTLDSIQAMEPTRGRERWSSVSDIRTNIQRALCRQQFYDDTNLRQGKDHRGFAVTFQIKSVLKNPYRWRHDNRHVLKKISFYDDVQF